MKNSALLEKQAKPISALNLANVKLMSWNGEETLSFPKIILRKETMRQLHGLARTRNQPFMAVARDIVLETLSNQSMLDGARAVGRVRGPGMGQYVDDLDYEQHCSSFCINQAYLHKIECILYDWSPCGDTSLWQALQDMFVAYFQIQSHPQTAHVEHVG